MFALLFGLWVQETRVAVGKQGFTLPLEWHGAVVGCWSGDFAGGSRWLLRCETREISG